MAEVSIVVPPDVAAADLLGLKLSSHLRRRSPLNRLLQSHLPRSTPSLFRQLGKTKFFLVLVCTVLMFLFLLALQS